MRFIHFLAYAACAAVYFDYKAGILNPEVTALILALAYTVLALSALLEYLEERHRQSK